MSKIPDKVRQRVRDHFGDRCAYCRSPQSLVPAPLEIDHIVPTSRGGSDDEDNLCLACAMCNRHKAGKINGLDPATQKRAPLFNPRKHIWTQHFRWSVDSTRIIGRTPHGRATIEALHLNNAIHRRVRGHWVQAGWHPPQDS